MSETFYELLAKRYAEPPDYPASFQHGQMVRVCKAVIQDGQTPHFWSGAVCKITNVRCTGMHKEWWYELTHDNGAVDWFDERDLDMRYAKSK